MNTAKEKIFMFFSSDAFSNTLDRYNAASKN